MHFARKALATSVIAAACAVPGALLLSATASADPIPAPAPAMPNIPFLNGMSPANAPAMLQGLASAFVPAGRDLRRAAVLGGTGLLLALPLMLVTRPVAGVTALAVELAIIAVVIVFSARRIGGFTGDVLGAAIVLGETAGLLALAARW